jgi:hypothetical protein
MGLLVAASFAACAARASGVQVVPVITAAAPMTALRMRNVRRSMPGEFSVAAGAAGMLGVVSGLGCVLMVITFRLG